MRRPEQLAELIREEVMQIVGYELADPRVESVTVTDVRVSQDLRSARVFVTAEGTDAERAEALKALQKAAPFVRRQLGTTLGMRYVPELNFVRDTVEESATRVDQLLSQLEQERTRQEAPPADEAEVPGERGDTTSDELGTMNDE